MSNLACEFFNHKVCPAAVICTTSSNRGLILNGNVNTWLFKQMLNERRRCIANILKDKKYKFFFRNLIWTYKRVRGSNPNRINKLQCNNIILNAAPSKHSCEFLVLSFRVYSGTLTFLTARCNSSVNGLIKFYDARGSFYHLLWVEIQ